MFILPGEQRHLSRRISIPPDVWRQWRTAEVSSPTVLKPHIVFKTSAGPSGVTVHLEGEDGLEPSDIRVKAGCVCRFTIPLYGAESQNRTDGLRLTKSPLCQLSYSSLS